MLAMHRLRTLLHRCTATTAAAALAAAGLTGVALTATVTAAPPAAALDNGLARTPQMGFNNWNSTGCGAAFNESMVKSIADLFVSKGLKAAGYEYVNLDDCWALQQRDADGKLVPDPARFPNGIKGVADYVHSKGLKLGIYTSAGTKTCNSKGLPGALGHEYSDARQFADWGVDYLKYDNCNNQGVDAVQRYTTMRDALAATGRPILYSICEWGSNKPWLWAKDVGNSWRTTGDISDNWGSMTGILKQNLPLAPYAGPGHWNDPDMLEVGNGGMTDTEYRSHFSLWSIMASPLLIGTDLRKASQSTFDILGNTDVIAVDQDPLGKQGTVLKDGSADGSWVIVKELADGSRAVALFNESGQPRTISTTARAAGLPAADGYRLRDLWQHTDYTTAGEISAAVPAHGTVLYRVSPGSEFGLVPPAVRLDASSAAAGGGAPLVTPGSTVRLTATATDLGVTPAKDVEVTAAVSAAGWSLTPTGPTTAKALPTDESLATGWDLAVPAGAKPGDAATVTFTVRYHGPASDPVTQRLVSTALVVAPPPAGSDYLSDLPFVSAANGWGPVERDTSNGETKAGDGHPLTINGQTWAKGLGVHAPSAVVFYTGGRCSTVTAQVGVDDEKTQNGSVVFQVRADDRTVADSGLLTTADPAKALTADVSGAQEVTLVVTDGGNGNDSDHADWADARVQCS